MDDIPVMRTHTSRLPASQNERRLFDNCLIPHFRSHKRLSRHDGVLAFQWEEEQIILGL